MVLDRFGVYEREAAPREHVKTEVTGLFAFKSVEVLRGVVPWRWVEVSR